MTRPTPPSGPRDDRAASSDGETPVAPQLETTTVAGSSDLTPQIFESVTKTLQRKAELLLVYLINNDVMAWNESGELVYDGNVIKGSNMVDLVNDTLKSRKNFVPYGFQHFMRGLAKSNVPESIIGNEARRNIVRKNKQGTVEKRLLPDLPTSDLHRTPFRLQKRPMVTSTLLRSRKKRFQWESL